MAGMSPEAARADAALGGAVVTLQRLVGDSFQTVLLGEPGISPNVNPEITPSAGPSKGLYQWDASAGEYRVQVTLPGYLKATSSVVTLPPPVTDLHVAMERKKPSAAFTVVSGAPRAGAQVTFSSTSTHPDGGAAIVAGEWDLDGDGQFDDAGGATATTAFAVGRYLSGRPRGDR